VAEHPQDSLAGSLIGSLVVTLWSYRVELALSTVYSMAWHLFDAAVGPDLGGWCGLGLALLVLVVPASRRRLWRMLGTARWRRRWDRAVRAVAISAFGGRPTRVGGVRNTPVGQYMTVQVPLGGSVADLERHANALAAAMGARDLRVRRWPGNASWAEVVVIRNDPLSANEPLACPWAETPSADLWQPVPVGMDETGAVVSVSLPEHNVLLGGEPGAGKSASLSLLVAAAALDPEVKLWLLDGKLVELAPWVGSAEASVGPNVAEAVDLLRRLQSEMDLRFAELLARRRRKVSPDMAMPLHVVVCDELALYLAGGERKERVEFAEVLRDLVARGRAAGVIVLAATQKPSSDIVPTSLRDLFGFRWALRCSTREASDTVLGSGWGSEGYSAADIDAATRGVGFLLHEGGVPVRMRSYYLDDATIARVAERAEALRYRYREGLS
jgi:hypothetical protein